jgi:hypothetical protein
MGLFISGFLEYDLGVVSLVLHSFGVLINNLDFLSNFVHFLDACVFVEDGFFVLCALFDILLAVCYCSHLPELGQGYECNAHLNRNSRVTYGFINYFWLVAGID